MDEELLRDLTESFKIIAQSLSGIYEIQRQRLIRDYPTPREQRQSVVTKVESDDDRARRNQGARLRTVAEVIDPTIDDEIPDDFLGERTRQWLRDHPQEARKDASAEAAPGGKPDGAGVEAAEDQTGNVSGGSPDIPNHKVVRKGRVQSSS